MLEVEQAALNTEAKSRLSELRSQLGLSAGPQAELAGPPQQAVPAAGETGRDAVPSPAQAPAETPAESETPRSAS
jgi:hypothetical protein